MRLWLWREKYRRIKDELSIWVAAAVPMRVAYYAMMRLVAHATTGKYSDTIVPELGAMDCLNRWDQDKLKEKRTMVGFDKDTMLPVRLAKAFAEHRKKRAHFYYCAGCNAEFVSSISLTECDKCQKSFCSKCICTPDLAPIPLCLGCIKDEVSVPVDDIEIGEERIGMSENHEKLEKIAGKQLPTGAELARSLKEREEQNNGNS